jgi:hypothetical protein
MEKPCGNKACSNTFTIHNNGKKYCSKQCYPSATTRGRQAKLTQRKTTPANEVPLAHITTPTPNYVESPDGIRAPRVRDDSSAPSPNRKSPPILDWGRQLRRWNANTSGTTVNSLPLPPATTWPLVVSPNSTPPAAPYICSEEGSEHPDDTTTLAATQQLHNTLDNQELDMENPTPIQESGTNCSSETPPRHGQLITNAGPAVNLLLPPCSREELDRVTENCAAEWHLLTLKADNATDIERQVSREQESGTHAAPRRQQSSSSALGRKTTWRKGRKPAESRRFSSVSHAFHFANLGVEWCYLKRPSCWGFWRTQHCFFQNRIGRSKNSNWGFPPPYC